MLTVAGGILIAAIVLGVVGLVIGAVSHWFGSSEARASRKKWEAEMQSRRNA